MNFLQNLPVRPLVALRRYNGNELVSNHIEPLPAAAEIAENGAQWQVETQIEARENGVFGLSLHVTPQQAVENAGFALGFAFDEWGVENYVLFPAAAYNGNRFHSVKGYRPDAVPDPSPTMPVTISDRQKLSLDGQASFVHFKVGALSTPGAAIFLAAQKTGILALTHQKTAVGEVALRLDEGENAQNAQLWIEAPCVRAGEIMIKRGDAGAKFEAGQTVELKVELHVFEAGDIPAFYQEFFACRESLPGPTQARPLIPFGACWKVQQAKYNAQNWVEEFGYYSVGMRESQAQDWQTGWTGGLNAFYPLLLCGDAQTRVRAIRTLDFLADGGVYPSGFWRSMCYKGVWQEHQHHLLRYSADGLFFAVKALFLLQSRGEEIKPGWREMVRGVARAFCDLWEKYGQLGHRLNGETGELTWGGTCCAAAAPGGLALAARFFEEPKFLEVAQAAAQKYRDEFLQIGLTNGGPGDALQCPDSESVFGLVESYATLWEETGQARWLEAGQAAIHQGASWVMTYDFEFPPASTFGKLGMQTTGTVFANIQNNHSAPGLCSLSGAGMLKIYRATGDERILELLRQIARAIPQYMSRADRPIVDIRPGQRWPVLAPGWINERVNTSDWEVRGDPQNEIGVGEVFGGSTWSEVAMLLTFAEVPGIYLDGEKIHVFDHLEARWNGQNLEISNPTPFDTTTQILIEKDRSQPLGAEVLKNARRVEIGAGQTVSIDFVSLEKDKRFSASNGF